MDLKNILAISGKGGLFKMLTQNKNSIIVESLIDKKRFPVYSHQQVSSLEEISIFTYGEDLQLKQVYIALLKKTDGKQAISAKSSNDELKAYFEEIVPDYDQERVYVSDIKKIISWYNQLIENNILTLEDANISDEEISGQEKSESSE